MKSELKEVSPTQREIHFQIPPEALKEAYGKATQKYIKGANVPGFRKGYAPTDVVRLRYKEEIKNEVLQSVIPDQVAEAIAEHGLQPLSEPHLHVDNIETVKVNGSEPIGLHIHVEVMPEISLPKYKGVAVTRSVRPVSDDEVEKLIADRLKEGAAMIPVEDRASEVGDTVIADLEGRFADDETGDPITASDLEVELGGSDIEPAFTENLVGVKPEEKKEFTVTYPAEFSSSALAGKTVNYKADIKSVGRSELPELNDDWAASLDEGYSSLDDLRQKLKADLEIYAGSEADARVRNDAVAKLIEDNEFEVPQTLVENQARNLLNNFARDLQSRGVDLERVEAGFVTMAFEQMKGQAERDVRGAMLLEKIAEAEKIEVGDEEVNEEIGRIAEMYRAEPEQIRASLEQQGGPASIANSLRTRKSIEAIVKHAKVTEGEWKEPGEAGEAEAAAEAEKKPKKAASKANSGTKAAKAVEADKPAKAEKPDKAPVKKTKTASKSDDDKKPTAKAKK